jgi:DNA-binding NarL/FixJ family response regulator
VLLDLRLAGPVDGLEAAQFLRTHLNLPVLMASGATDATILVRAHQVSPTGVLAKPVEDHDLQSAFHEALTGVPTAWRPPGEGLGGTSFANDGSADRTGEAGTDRLATFGPSSRQLPLGG